MRPLLRSLALLALSLLALPAQAALAPISTSTGSANGWTCQVVTWTDSKGLPRSAWIATTNNKITRLTYYVGATLVTDNEVSGYGLGNLTNHHTSGCAAVTRLGAGVSLFSGSAALAGSDHYIWRNTFRFASCGSGYSWRVNNDYVFINGRDDFLQTVTYDSSDTPTGTVMNDDMRGPYDQMTWGGNVSVGVSGVGWGNTYKFRTTSAFTPSTAGCPYSCSGNMSWDWTQPNTIPYIWAWKSPAQGADIDREYGVVQNQKEDEQDFGGGFYGSGNMPASLPAASAAPHAMFDCWAAPTQMDCYDSPWNSTRMTWGATYSTFNNGHANDRGVPVNKLSFRPINSWSWMHLVDAHSAGGVPALVADTENIYKSTLTATLPTSIATSGPRGAGNYVGPTVGTMPTITYPKPGYDYVYRAWTLETAGVNASFSLSIPVGATLVRPIFALRAAPGLPCKVTLDGATLALGTDYSATYDAAGQKLWLSLHSTLASGSRAVQVLFTCGTPTPTQTPCAACSPTATVTASPTYTQTASPTPTSSCTPVLIDDMEDNNTQNAFGGWWSTWAGSSTILPSPYAMTAGGHSSSYGAKASGTNNLAGQPSLSTSFSAATDVSAFVGVSFWFNGDGGSYRFQVHSQVQGSDYNDYKADFSPPAGWSLVTLPFTSFTHPGWGPAYPLDLTQWLGISWVPMTAGAYAFTVDDVMLVCPAAPTPTRSPTFGGSPTPTPSTSPTRSPSHSATVSPSNSATRTASPTASPSPTATPTFTPLSSRTATPTSSATPTPTYPGSPTASPTATDYAGTPTSTDTVTPTASASPTGTDTATCTPTEQISSTSTTSPTPSSSATGSATRTVTATSTLGIGSPTPTPTWSYTCACGFETATPTPTPTVSTTCCATGTFTPSATVTRTPTVDPAAPASPTAQAWGPPELEQVVPWPNPGARQVQFKVKGKAEQCRLELYTPAMVLAYGVDLPRPAPGWNQADLRPGLGGLASGLYFVRVQVKGGGFTDGRIARALLLP